MSLIILFLVSCVISGITSTRNAPVSSPGTKILFSRAALHGESFLYAWGTGCWLSEWKAFLFLTINKILLIQVYHKLILPTVCSNMVNIHSSTARRYAILVAFNYDCCFQAMIHWEHIHETWQQWAKIHWFVPLWCGKKIMRTFINRVSALLLIETTLKQWHGHFYHFICTRIPFIWSPMMYSSALSKLLFTILFPMQNSSPHLMSRQPKSLVRIMS